MLRTENDIGTHRDNSSPDYERGLSLPLFYPSPSPSPSLHRSPSPSHRIGSPSATNPSHDIAENGSIPDSESISVCPGDGSSHNSPREYNRRQASEKVCDQIRVSPAPSPTSTLCNPSRSPSISVGPATARKRKSVHNGSGRETVVTGKDNSTRNSLPVKRTKVSPVMKPVLQPKKEEEEDKVWFKREEEEKKKPFAVKNENCMKGAEKKRYLELVVSLLLTFASMLDLHAVGRLRENEPCSFFVLFQAQRDAIEEELDRIRARSRREARRNAKIKVEAGVGVRVKAEPGSAKKPIPSSKAMESRARVQGLNKERKLSCEGRDRDKPREKLEAGQVVASNQNRPSAKRIAPFPKFSAPPSYIEASGALDVTLIDF